jgi:peptidoglycan/xylan/chitin deacetylase (PgdA/CDA1 family)
VAVEPRVHGASPLAGSTGGKLVAWAIERIKALPAARRASAVAAIEGRTPRFRPSASQHAAHDVLTWEELRSLPAGLIGVGSHGWTHEVLAGIGAERLDLEIRESRQRIEQRLGRPVECFCYPNGIVDAPALESARRVYRAALTMRSGFVRPSDDPHLLARVWVPATLPALSWRLFRPRRSGWSGPSEAER